MQSNDNRTIIDHSTNNSSTKSYYPTSQQREHDKMRSKLYYHNNKEYRERKNNTDNERNKEKYNTDHVHRTKKLRYLQKWKIMNRCTLPHMDISSFVQSAQNNYL